jgi:hypothetical protein
MNWKNSGPKLFSNQINPKLPQLPKFTTLWASLVLYDQPAYKRPQNRLCVQSPAGRALPKKSQRATENRSSDLSELTSEAFSATRSDFISTGLQPGDQKPSIEH